MIINTPEVKKILDDYDIVFSTGMLMPLTLDKSVGDSIEITNSQLIIHLVPKPSKVNPEKMMLDEDITIFLKHVASIQHKKREVLEPTVEEKAEWAKTWGDLTAHPTLQ